MTTKVTVFRIKINEGKCLSEKKKSETGRTITRKASRVNDDPLHRPFAGFIRFFLQQHPDLFGIVGQRAAKQHGKWSLKSN